MEIIKIKSTHPASQGDFVLIYKDEFDPEKGHVLYESEDEGEDKKIGIAELRALLQERGIGFDPKAKKAELLKLAGME